MSKRARFDGVWVDAAFLPRGSEMAPEGAIYFGSFCKVVDNPDGFTGEGWNYTADGEFSGHYRSHSSMVRAADVAYTFEWTPPGPLPNHILGCGVLTLTDPQDDTQVFNAKISERATYRGYFFAQGYRQLQYRGRKVDPAELENRSRADLVASWIQQVREQTGLPIAKKGEFARVVPLAEQTADPQRRNERTMNTVASNVPMENVRIFITHSARDESLAGVLVHCVEACLEVPDGTIRCTSVPGYRLPPSAHSDQTLQRDLEQCSVVIGLLTEESLRSGYVIMELGAAWGLKKVICPVLAPEIDFGRIPGPLATTHAIKIDRSEDVVQLMDVISSAADMPLRNRAKCMAAIRVLVEAARSRHP